jgi:hypothetical protein
VSGSKCGRGTPAVADGVRLERLTYKESVRLESLAYNKVRLESLTYNNVGLESPTYKVVSCANTRSKADSAPLPNRIAIFW